MRRILQIFSVMMTLSNPFALAILGIVIAVAFSRGENAHPDNEAKVMRACRAIVSDDGGDVRVSLNNAKPDTPAKLVVRTAAGDQLGKLIVYNDQSFTFESTGTIEPTGTEPGAFIVHRDTPHSFRVGGRIGCGELSVISRADGSADMVIKNSMGRPMFDLRVTRDGEVIRDQFPRASRP